MAEENSSGNAPAADTKDQGTGSGEQTPSQDGKEENVTLSKKAHDELQKKVAQLSEAQTRADTLQSKVDRFEKQGKRKVEDGTATTFTAEERLAAVTAVNAKILQNANYQKLIAGNKMLAKIIASRPWELLDTDDFADPADLVDQVSEVLDDLVLSGSSATGSTPPAEKTEEKAEDKKEEEKKENPQPTATNPSGTGSPTSDKEQPKRAGLYTTVDKVADSIKSRINIK
jgi:hypothetical protein